MAKLNFHRYSSVTHDPLEIILWLNTLWYLVLNKYVLSMLKTVVPLYVLYFFLQKS